MKVLMNLIPAPFHDLTDDAYINQIYKVCNQLNNRPDRLYWIVPNSAVVSDLLGASDPRWSCRLNLIPNSGKVAIGTNNSDTFTHEILHLLDSQGLKHPGDGFCQDSGYPNADQKLDVPGVFYDSHNMRWDILSEDQYYDFMSVSDSAIKQWISEYNYEKLMNGDLPPQYVPVIMLDQLGEFEKAWPQQSR